MWAWSSTRRRIWRSEGIRVVRCRGNRETRCLKKLNDIYAQKKSKWLTVEEGADSLSTLLLEETMKGTSNEDRGPDFGRRRGMGGGSSRVL